MNVAPSTPGRRVIWHLGRGLIWVAIGCGGVGMAYGRSVYRYMEPLRSPVSMALASALFFVAGGALLILGLVLMLLAAWLDEREFPTRLR